MAENRDELAEYLAENEIGYSIYYPRPIHLQVCFRDLGYKKGDFPIAEKVSNKIIALPIYPEMTTDDVEFICVNIKSFYKN